MERRPLPLEALMKKEREYSVAWLALAVASFLFSPHAAAQLRQVEDVLGLHGTGVVQVGGVEPGLPGAAAGIQPGDLILAFNGHRIREFTKYKSFLDALRIVAFNGGVTLDILRYDSASDSYTPRSVSLTLTTEPVD